MRTTVFRILASGAAAALTLGSLAAITPAHAAAGAEVFTIDDWGDHVFGPYSQVITNATATPGDGGVRLVGTDVSTLERGISMYPPVGGQFVAGTTYPSGPDRTSTIATVNAGMEPCWNWTGIIEVHEAVYANGTLTSFAADYRSDCTSGKRKSGSLRFDSTRPWTSLNFTGGVDLDPAAIGEHADSDVTFSFRGTGTVTPGAATISGLHAADFSVVGNHCADAPVSGEGTCTVTVRFEPGGSDAGVRGAWLDLPVAGHPGLSARAELEADAVLTPGTPVATAIPVASGAAITWTRPDPVADEYAVYRRTDPVSPWVEQAVVEDEGHGEVRIHVDTAITPGASAEYAVTALRKGWEGAMSAPVTATRPAAPTVPGADSRVVTSTTAGSTVVRSTTDGWNVQGGHATRPQVSASRSGDPSWSFTFSPVGPGSFDGDEIDPTFARASLRCDQPQVQPEITRVIVRDVLYSAELEPVVLDASVLHRCPGTEATKQAEIRLGVDTPRARLGAAPVAVETGVVAPGSETVFPLTLSNDGPDALTLGVPAVSGPNAGDWSAAPGTCTGTLAPDATCTMSLDFVPTAGRARIATLEVPTVLGGAAGPPFLVPLSGYQGAPPAAPQLGVTSLLDRTGVRVFPSEDDGGAQETELLVQRSTSPDGPFVDVGTAITQPDAHRFVDTDLEDGVTYYYRAAATNQYGTGPWSETDQPSFVHYGGMAARSVFYVHDGDLWATDETNDVPLTDDDHEHLTPAVSWAGTSLAYARGTAPGDDTEEYDLWVRPTRDDSAPATRLTDLPGAELDPAFSPDGTRIAFSVFDGDTDPSVWVVPADGSSDAVKVADVAADPSWLDAGTLVAEDWTDLDAPLRRIVLASGAQSPIAGTDGGTSPAVSNDGVLAYVTTWGGIALGADEDWFYRDFATFDELAWSSQDRLFAESDGDVVHIEDPGNWTLLGSGGDPAPAFVDAAAPRLSVSVPTLTGARATATITRGDDSTPVAGLRQTCRLDGGAVQSCGASWSLPTLTTGAHVVEVSVTDGAGLTTTATNAFTADAVAPTVSAPTGVSAFSLGKQATFRYAGADADSGVADYDVRLRTTSARAGAQDGTRRDWSGVRDLAVTVPLNPGDEACVDVRTRDKAGNVSGWSSETCTAAPLDDRSLKGKGWKRIRSSKAFRSTLTRATAAGATLSAGTVTAGRVSLLATTCDSCGKVKVLLGKRVLGKVDLRTDRTRTRRVITVRTGGAPLTGRLRIVVLKGKPRIDGVGLRST